MGKPYVSVLIDTYNHERFIEQAVRSVLEQDFPAGEREIVVVDDGSSDRTGEIVRKFEPDVRYLRKSNAGQASAFNAGIPECRGEIVAFLDGDDWWAANKLKVVVEALRDPEIGLVGHGIIEAYEDGRLHTELVRENTRFRIDSEAGARIFRVRKSFLGTSRMTFRASLLEKIGRVPETLAVEADEYLFTIGGALSNVVILREPLTYYRLHDANAFKTASAESSTLRRKQKVLEALCAELSTALPKLGVPPKARGLILESAKTEADLLRLRLENGWPWETLRAELREYGTTYATASVGQRLVKLLGLLPACVLPSRSYYAYRHRFAAMEGYRRLRGKWLPFPEPTHVDRYRATRP